MVRGLSPLEFLHQVLDVPEAVASGKAQQHHTILLQGHLLEVLVPMGEGEIRGQDGGGNWVRSLNVHCSLPVGIDEDAPTPLYLVIKDMKSLSR